MIVYSNSDSNAIHFTHKVSYISILYTCIYLLFTLNHIILRTNESDVKNEKEHTPLVLTSRRCVADVAVVDEILIQYINNTDVDQRLVLLGDRN